MAKRFYSGMGGLASQENKLQKDKVRKQGKGGKVKKWCKGQGEKV